MQKSTITSYPKISYNYDNIALTPLFINKLNDDYLPAPVMPASAKKVFGDLRLPPLPENRVYTMASFVTSIDGKVAFPDDTAGPIVAKANALDPDGAEADFWVLNLFRANADIIIGGAGTLHEEPDGIACIFDQDLENERTAQGMPALPWVMICSLDGTDIPFHDTLFTNQPFIIHTSPAGIEPVKQGIKTDHFIVGPYERVEDVLADKEQISAAFQDAFQGPFHGSFQDPSQKPGDSWAPVIITGKGNTTNPGAALAVLKVMGFNRALVESPSYCHVLMGEGLLDEITLNYSCVYIGGTAVGLGNGLTPYTAKKHPHTEMLSIHMHSPSFFYFRHKLRYLPPYGA